MLCYNKFMDKDEKDFPHWKRWLIIIVMVLIVIGTVLVNMFLVKWSF